MLKPLLAICIYFILTQSMAQGNGFKFGTVDFNELNLKLYPKDTAANAVILNEFGESWIDSDEHSIFLLHEYHVRIKIINSKGFKHADISIPLRRGSNGDIEKISQVVASTYNLQNNAIQESKFEPKGIFVENKSKFWDLAKFTLPNVKEGSVIEFKYRLQSPYFFNFRSWEFQSDIPKIHSEYWTKIPGYYAFNTTLKGFYKLTKNESEIVKDCFMPGGGAKADCSLMKYAMDHIPAFIEEDYMTAASNFISSINFEMSEMQTLNGQKKKYTKTWEDVDKEMRTDQKFGGQLRKGKDAFDSQIKAITSTTPDSLQRARKIYSLIKTWYKWNGYYGAFSELGIKKAADTKTGNVGDINLSLVAALNYAGLNAEPMILSTRENGLPIELYPIISDFNYVIAKVNVNNKIYLLDATDPYLPFGMLPMRCLVGKGRVFANKKASYWHEIKPTDKLKEVTLMQLALQKDGNFTGKVITSSDGYEALNSRKKISSFNNQDEYIESVDEKWNKIKIKKFEISNLDSLDNGLKELFEVEIEGFENLNKNKLFLNPFFLGEWDKNPFKSSERLFPVDLGAPMESHLSLNLEYPSEYQLSNIPQPMQVSLPNNGGKYAFSVQNIGSRMILNSVLTLNKPIYSPQEYHYLKELFNKMVQSYQTSLVFTKK